MVDHPSPAEEASNADEAGYRSPVPVCDCTPSRARDATSVPPSPSSSHDRYCFTSNGSWLRFIRSFVDTRRKDRASRMLLKSQHFFRLADVEISPMAKVCTTQYLPRKVHFKVGKATLRRRGASQPFAARCLKRLLSIRKERIFDSSVERGMPRRAAAPAGPKTLPPHSRSASSMIVFS